MFSVLRSAAVRILPLLASKNNTPYRNFTLYQDGRPFMVINAPSFEHARFIVAGFSAESLWMLVPEDE